MKLSRISIAKALLAVLPALLVAFVLQPAVALAYDVTFTTDGNGWIVDPEITDEKLLESYVYSTSKNIKSVPNTKAKDGFTFGYWTVRDPYSIVLYYWPSGFTSDTQLQSDDLLMAEVGDDTAVLIAHFESTSQAQATVTFGSAGNGTVSGPQTVDLSQTASVGSVDTKYGVFSAPTTNPDENYVFDYWTVKEGTLYTLSSDKISLEPISSDEHISADALSSCSYVTGDVILTAHFKQAAFTVKYLSAGHGTVSPTFEWVDEGDVPSATLTVTPEAGYKFSHWTANMDVVLNESTRNATTTIKAGDPISDEQRQLISVTKELELTANFEKDPDYVDPDDSDGSDDSDKVTPASGSDSGSKLTPKTGDSLPGATATAVLGAGALLVAGIKLARRRCQ